MKDACMKPKHKNKIKFEENTKSTIKSVDSSSDGKEIDIEHSSINKESVAPASPWYYVNLKMMKMVHANAQGQ